MKTNVLPGLLALWLVALLAVPAFPQNASVSGRVTSQSGEALPGVSILMKGSKSGTTTNADGQYQFTVSTAEPTLIFSAIGFVTQEVSIGKKSTLDVVLAEDTKTLNEVVVTALGIKREEKSLGFAAQTVNENAVKDAKSNNWANTLSGKVAGLNIQGAGAGPMGSSRITLRGESSLNLDNNQALIVVDGVPISSKITGTGYSSYLSADSPVDYGSNLSDINPDDIEKITVLKGPGATALYGSRAAGGAIIIVTKSGVRKDRGIGITVNSNFNVDQVNRWPDYQFEYGEGRTNAYFSYLASEDGPNTATTVAAGRAWGPKFDGQSYFQFDPNAPDGKPTVRTPWVADKDYISGFFQTGTTFSNSISVEGGSEKGSARLSLTHLKNTWIIPNTGFERINAALSVSQQVSDKLKINGKVNYANKKSDNLPIAGYNNQSLMYFAILGTAPNIRPEWFKPYWVPGLEQIKQREPFNPTPDNPYLGMYEMLNTMNKNGLIGNLSATYAISPKFDLLLRTGLDMAFEFRSQQRPFSMTRFPRGMYREQNVFSYESNSDFLLSYRDKIGSRIDVTASAGSNAMRQSYDFAGIYADQLAQPGIYQISNSLDQAVADPVKTRKAINSVYATTQFAFDEKIFIDLTGRNDWSSTLPLWQQLVLLPLGQFEFPAQRTVQTADGRFLRQTPGFVGAGRQRHPPLPDGPLLRPDLRQQLHEFFHALQREPETRNHGQLRVRTGRAAVQEPPGAGRGLLRQQEPQPDSGHPARPRVGLRQRRHQRRTHQQPGRGGEADGQAREDQKRELEHHLAVVAQPQLRPRAGLGHHQPGHLQPRQQRQHRGPGGRTDGRHVRARLPAFARRAGHLLVGRPAGPAGPHTEEVGQCLRRLEGQPLQ